MTTLRRWWAKQRFASSPSRSFKDPFAMVLRKHATMLPMPLMGRSSEGPSQKGGFYLWPKQILLYITWRHLPPVPAMPRNRRAVPGASDSYSIYSNGTQPRAAAFIRRCWKWSFPLEVFSRSIPPFWFAKPQKGEKKMANILKAVKDNVSKLIRWTFENDNVYINRDCVSRTGNYRR